MQILELRLALLSAGYIRLIWPKTERLCLFGSVSVLVVQCVLTQYLQHTFFMSIYVRALMFLGRIRILGCIH